MFLIAEKYFRIRFENGKDASGATLLSPYASTTSSNLQIQVMFNTNRPMELGQQMGDNISDWYGGGMTKAVLAGRLESGNYKNVGVDTEARLKVSNPIAAYDESLAVIPNAVIQLDFVYGINTQMSSTTVVGSGTGSVTSGLLSVGSGAASNSSAIHVSKRYLKFRNGQGGVGIFDALFTAGTAGNNQYAGLTTTNLSNGYAFGYTGTTFGIFMLNNNVATHIPQSTWNYDVMDGSKSTSNPSGMLLVKTFFNLYQIEYQFSGGADFLIQNSSTNEFVLVHRIYYVNLNTIQSLRQPSLNLIWGSFNTTNTSNVVVNASSGSAFIQGNIYTLGPRYSIDYSKSGITTLVNIITLRNATTYNTVINRAQVKLKTLSFAANGNNSIVTLLVIQNTTLGGTPVFTTINGTSADNGVTITSGNSVVSYDIVGTITGGIVIYNITINGVSTSTVDLTDAGIVFSPSDIITFAVKATVSSVASIAVNWVEDI